MGATSQSGVSSPAPVIAKRTPITAGWANGVTKAITDLSRRGDNQAPRPLAPRIVSAFWPKFYRRDNATYFTLSPGSIIERHTITGEAMGYWPITSTDTDGNEIEYGPIASDDSGYVHYDVKPIGSVGSGSPYVDPEIVIATTAASVHYAPPIEDDAGSAGTKYVKLFTVHWDDTEKTLSVDKFAMGDNVNHWRELPMFVTPAYTDGVGRVIYKYDLTVGKFLERGIKCDSPLHLEESESLITLSMETGPNFNILPVRADLGLSAGFMDISGTDYTDDMLYVRNGVFVAANADAVKQYRMVGEIYGEGDASGTTGAIITTPP